MVQQREFRTRLNDFDAFCGHLGEPESEEQAVLVEKALADPLAHRTEKPGLEDGKPGRGVYLPAGRCHHCLGTLLGAGKDLQEGNIRNQHDDKGLNHTYGYYCLRSL